MLLNFLTIRKRPDGRCRLVDGGTQNSEFRRQNCDRLP